MVADDPSVVLVVVVATVPAGVPADADETDMLAKPVPVVCVFWKFCTLSGPEVVPKTPALPVSECVCPESVAVCV